MSSRVIVAAQDGLRTEVISRSHQDGIGGLLGVEDVAAGGGSSQSYWFFYDANGNVGQLIKASDRSLAAHYEYDPYGNAIVATGPDGGVLARTNPWRFSTKYYDAELDAPGTSASEGLYYYGYRSYSPRLGRWMGRDPIEEAGSLNLHAFVQNAPVFLIDPDGRAVPIAIAGCAGGIGIAEAVAASFGLSLAACMATPACRAAVEAALRRAADECLDKAKEAARSCRRLLCKHRHPTWPSCSSLSKEAAVRALAAAKVREMRILGGGTCFPKGASRDCANIGSDGTFYICTVVMVDRFGKFHERNYSVSECSCCRTFRSGTMGYHAHETGEQGKGQ